MAEHNIEAENIYNTDETGFLMGHAQSRRVIEIIRHPRDEDGRLFLADLPELSWRSGQTLQDGSREFATVICCICADGTFLDSAIIFKAKNLQDSWLSNMAGVPDSFLFGVSPNGWTDNSKALAWLERLFGPDSTSEKKATRTNDDSHDLPRTPPPTGTPAHPALQTRAPGPGHLPKWRLLMFDGHISHVNQAFLHQFSTTEFYLSASLPIQHTFYNPWMSQCLVHLNEHIQICFRHSMPKENVGFGKATSTSFLTVHKRRPLQVPIFLVDFIILDCGL